MRLKWTYLLTKVIANPELSGTIFVGIGMMLGNVFSYLLQFSLGRLLTVEDFGTFTALLSLSYLIGVPSGVISTSLVKTVSKLLSEKDFTKLTYLFKRLSILSLCVGGFIFFVLLVLVNPIASYLKIKETQIVLFFALAMGLSLFSSIPRSYFQGLLRYKAYSLFIVLANLFRFVIPVLFVLMGLGLSGVFIGLCLASVLISLISILLLKKNFSLGKEVNLHSEYKQLLLFSVPVLFINFGLMMLNNIDILLVKSYFSELEAGYYAGVVTIGKILLFGTSAVNIIMFPKIVSQYYAKTNWRKSFCALFFLQTLLVVAGVLFFAIFPDFVTRIFFGYGFAHSSIYLPLFAVFMGMYVIDNFLILFLLAIEKTKTVWVFIPTLLFQYLFITLEHATLFAVIKANILASIILFILLVAHVAKELNILNRQALV